MASGYESISRGSDESISHECDACKYQNITSDAASYCTTCAEYLCKPCEQAHKGSRLTRDHRIISEIDKMLDPIKAKPTLPIMFCDVHKTTLLDVYCKSHDEVLCRTCKLINHKNCETTGLSQQSHLMRNSSTFKETMSRLANLKGKYARLKDDRVRDKTLVNSQIQTCFQDMKKLRDEIDRRLDELEKEITKEIRDTEMSMVKEIEDHETIADDALTQITSQIVLMTECQTSQDADTMFVGVTKSNAIAKRFDSTLVDVQCDIHPIKLKFKANSSFKDAIDHLNSIGTVLNVSKPTSNPGQCQNSIVDMYLVDKKEVDVGSRDVFDCTFMPNEHLIITCGEKGIKLLDRDFQVKSEMSITAIGVTALNANEVMITQGDKKLIQRIKLAPGMKVEKKMKLDKYCSGIHSFGDEIYVACYNYHNQGEVQVLNMDGVLLRKLGFSKGKHLFLRPEYVTVSRDGTKLFVSDFETDAVTCMNQSGHVIYEFYDRTLLSPAGMYVDAHNNVLVCGYESHECQVVDKDGRKGGILMSKREGIEKPQCIAYRPSDGCLVVGLGSYARSTENRLIIYTTKQLA